MATYSFNPADDILTEADALRRAAYAAIAYLRALDDEPAEDDGEYDAEADEWERQLQSNRACAQTKL